MKLTLELNGSPSEIAALLAKLSEVPAFQQLVASAGLTTGARSRRLSSMGFSTKTFNRFGLVKHPDLEEAGIETAGQLADMTRRDLMYVRGFGQGSLDEVEEKLSELGLKLSG